MTKREFFAILSEVPVGDTPGRRERGYGYRRA
jgi:hypothetical protein